MTEALAILVPICHPHVLPVCRPQLNRALHTLRPIQPFIWHPVVQIAGHRNVKAFSRLSVDNRELLIGDCILLVAFCLYKQVAAQHTQDTCRAHTCTHQGSDHQNALDCHIARTKLSHRPARFLKETVKGFVVLPSGHRWICTLQRTAQSCILLAHTSLTSANS